MFFKGSNAYEKNKIRGTSLFVFCTEHFKVNFDV